jgi:steroid 5-alpha reductase family enzyme
MLTEFLNLLWPATLFAVVLMVFIWWLALRINNLGIVDIAWSAAFAPVAIFYAGVAPGDLTRRWLVAGMATLWSLRLGLHLYIRVTGHHPQEDVRYAQMRVKWGKHVKRQVFIFFQLQAILIALLSAPFLVACLNPAPRISLLEWAGVVVWAVALIGEGFADRQLKRFRSRPENRGQICQAGLWNYSRHPNYFFEWLVWVGFFLFAWDSPGGCYTVLCPGLMLFFLLRVTGIPLTEELSVKSKGDAYRAYQRTTSAFVPWFKKKPALRLPASLL